MLGRVPLVRLLASRVQRNLILFLGLKKRLLKPLVQFPCPCSFSLQEAEQQVSGVSCRISGGDRHQGCLCYFFIAATKHHGQGNLQKKTFHWADVFRVSESMRAEQRPGGKKS